MKFFVNSRNLDDEEEVVLNEPNVSFQGRISPDSCYASSEATDGSSQGRRTPNSLTVSETNDSAQGTSSER